MFIRGIKKTDIKDILDIRVSTKENHFSMTDLAEVEVTPESVAEWLDGSVKGWICEISGQPVGCVIADRKPLERSWVLIPTILVVALLTFVRILFEINEKIETNFAVSLFGITLLIFMIYSYYSANKVLNK